MKKFFAVCLALFLLAGILAARRWRPSQWSDVFVMPFRRDGRTGAVKLSDGEPLRDFASDVRDSGLVADAPNLLYWLTKKGADRALRSGTYRLSSGPSWYVAEQLKTAVPAYESEIVLPGAPPGRPLPLGDEKEQRAALSDDANFPAPMLKILPGEPEARAAFLLPDRYALTERSAPALVRSAAAQWFSRFGASFADRDAALRAAVVASLLQREGQRADEYATIAGVIENRLARNMLLQIDATVVYAWYLLKGETLRRVYRKHLKTDSPYNTYTRAGLPPLPICVPSAEAWEGALAPAKHDYLFYVAKGDGSHVFAKTAKEHAANVKKYIAKK